MKSIKRAFVLAIMLVAACNSSKQVDPLGSTFQRGDEIVTALEQYRGENRVYPERLEDLVPRYLSELRAPDYGEKKWDYIYYKERNDFGLFVWGARPYRDGYWYDSSKKRWEVVNNSFLTLCEGAKGVTEPQFPDLGKLCNPECADGAADVAAMVQFQLLGNPVVTGDCCCAPNQPMACFA